MIWTDVLDIAIELAETYPEEDVVHIRFTDMREKVLALPNFEGEPNGCNERILEAIQAAWLEEIS